TDTEAWTLRLECSGKNVGAGMSLGGTMVQAVSGGAGCADSSFHHIALCVDDGNLELYFDGAQVGKTTTAMQPPLTGGALHIGSSAVFASTANVPVLLRQVRVSAGHRYTAAFTPEKELAEDEDTTILFALDEGTGTTVTDSSGQTELSLPSAA